MFDLEFDVVNMNFGVAKLKAMNLRMSLGELFIEI
jgi:hypothetical protein